MLTLLDTGFTLISDGFGDGVPEDRELRADTEQVVLRDGSIVVIRILAAGDEAAIARWFAGRFAGLDADTLYARLVVLLGRLDPRTEPLLEGVGRFEHEAIMAFAADGVTGRARVLLPQLKQVVWSRRPHGGQATRSSRSRAAGPRNGRAVRSR